MAKDYYAILGVGRGASKDEIAKAFRTLAHKYHPDKKDGDDEKFREVNEAYQVLSDDTKRAQYDSYGAGYHDAGAGPGGGFSGFGGGDGFDMHFDFSDLGDIFSAFSGGRGEGQRVNLEQVVHTNISFAESYRGIKKDVSVEQQRICEICAGSGAEKGAGMKVCPKCSGSGRIKQMQRTIFGQFENVRTCPECSGSGRIPEKKCAACGGEGVRHVRRTITVEIPAGIAHNQQLRLRGEGHQISSGQSGDLYVVVGVVPDPEYMREGLGITKAISVPWTMAILGGTTDIDWIGSRMSVDIPSGTQPGDVLRLKNKGFPSMRRKSETGDGYVKLRVELPKKVNKKQKTLLESWDTH